jgi:AraC family transcriptional regulator
MARADPNTSGTHRSVLHLSETPWFSMERRHLCFWAPLQGEVMVEPQSPMRPYRFGGRTIAVMAPSLMWAGGWQGRLSCFELRINPAVLLELAPGTIVHPSEGRLSLLDDDQLLHGLLALRHELASPSPAGDLFSGHVARAIAAHYVRRYCRAAIDTIGRKLSAEQLRRACEMIEASLGQKVRLEELARTVGLSATRFCTWFKRSTGLSPYQYVLRRKVHRAQELLLHNSRPIAELAQSLGFYDQSQFANTFRRYTGISPGEFRRGHGR